jgi:hypothetical protein
LKMKLSIWKNTMRQRKKGNNLIQGAVFRGGCLFKRAAQARAVSWTEIRCAFGQIF